MCKKLLLSILFLGSNACASQIDTKGIKDSAITTPKIAASAVDNTKLSNMSTQTVKGRVTGGSGDPEDLTTAEITTLINSFTAGLSGSAPASGGGTANFLRADGTWATPVATGANTFLSNLDVTTTINQNLNFVYGSGKSVHLDKDVYITGRNSTDTGDIDLIKVDAFNRTTIASGAGQTIQLVNSMFPAANNTYALGGGVAWSTVGSNVVSLSNSGEYARLGSGIATPSGASGGGPSFKTTQQGANLSLFSTSDAVLDANSTGNLFYESGYKTNASATGATGSHNFRTGNNLGSGNSGGYSLIVGTVVSGTQGAFKFQKSGVANSIADVWTASDTAGTGYWAAPAASGASTTLNNLGTTAVNADIKPGTTNTIDLGLVGNKWRNIYAGTALYSPLIQPNSAGGGALTMSTVDQATTASGGAALVTGNVAGGSGNSGAISLTTGTSAGGNRGKIIATSALMNVVSGLAVIKLTADPCGDTLNFPESTQFYNDTSDYYCFCNGAGADVQMHAPATACF